MNIENEVPTSVIKALFHLIEQFLERKELVVEILLEHRPGFFKFYDMDKIMGIDDIDERIERSKELCSRWYNDFDYDPDELWNGWHYFIHGLGCKLTHAITKEPIEWDVGYPDSFNISWFGENLEWRMQNQPEDSNIILCNDWVWRTGRSIYDAIRIMREKNIIIPREGFGGWFLNKDVLTLPPS